MQSSRLEVFHKKGVFKNVPKFTGKHLCQSLLFNNNKVEKEIDNLPSCRLVFSRFFDLRGNPGNVKEKPTRKTCFSREKKRLTPRIYLAKFC